MSDKSYAVEARLNAHIADTGDPWHTFTALGYANSWSNGTQTPGQYRLEPQMRGVVSLAGSLTVPAGFAVGQTIVTLPSGYRPLAGHTQAIFGRNMTTGNAIVSFTLGSGGNLQWGGAQGGTNAGDDIIFSGLIYLDA